MSDETVVDDNSARVFGTPEETAGKIRDDFTFAPVEISSPDLGSISLSGIGNSLGFSYPFLGCNFGRKSSSEL